MFFGFETEYLLILFVLGTFSAIINVVSGGGSALILPVLIMMGMDSATANGTNRVAILALTLSAVLTLKKYELSDFKFSLKMSLFTLPGVVLGAYYAQQISTETFKEILGWIILIIIILMIIPNNTRLNLTKDLSKYKKLIYVSMVFIGFYGGFIQTGVGFILMILLQSFLELDLLKVNMHKVFIVFIYTIPAFIIFAINDHIEWVPAIVLAVGNVLGAWYSVKMSVKKGDKFIKLILIISLIIMSLKMLEVF